MPTVYNQEYYQKNREKLKARSLAYYYQRKQAMIESGEAEERLRGRPRKEPTGPPRGSRALPQTPSILDFFPNTPGSV